MVELFPERRRAEVFARALDGHAAPTDARLQDLLDTATRLAAVPLVQPRAEFRDSLRARLMEAAAAELPARSVTSADAPAARPRHAAVTAGPRAVRRRRRLVAVATGLVVIGGGAGVAAASEQALPGEVLYPVKRTLESAEVGLARGDAAEGRALLGRATTRLDEVEALSATLKAGGSRPAGSGLAGVESALDDFAADAATGGGRLLQAYSETGDPADLRTLRDFTGDSHRVLAGLAGTLPPQAQTSLTAADDALIDLDDAAQQACPGCTLAPPLQGLPDQPVLLPDVAGNATPDIPGATQKPTPPHRGAGGTQANDFPGPQPTPSVRLPLLPDLNLGGTGGQQQERGTAPGQRGGGSGGQQSPLDLGDVLAPQPAPRAPQRTVDAPIPGDLGGVTGPLTDPLQPLLGGAGNTVQDTQDGVTGGLGGLL